ncbi:MAG: hypothetical protein ACAH95_11200 [Fimbriimonas sp.]
MREDFGDQGSQVQWHSSTMALLALHGDSVTLSRKHVVWQSATDCVLAFPEGEAALRFALATMEENPRASAGLLLGAISDLIVERARALAAYGEPGQLLITLAVQDLVRDCSLPVSFLEIGSTELVGRQERVFLVNKIGSQHIKSEQQNSRELESEAADHWGIASTASFIGRRNDLARLKRSMDLSKLVTVHGGPGTGKSALVRRFFFESESHFEDGAWLIDLGQVRHPELVSTTICRAVGTLKLPGEGRVDSLISGMRAKKALLILDNCQATTATVRVIVLKLLQECPHVAIIVGSRRPLKTANETRMLLQGLETPAFAEDWRAIREYDAVALFEERAQAYDSSFEISDANAADVALLCRKLDGVPLAIELAASKAALLTPRQIMGRLEDRLLLLKDESGGHRLEDTIRWSYELLSANAQQLLDRLCVFKGSFSVDSAEAVCACDDLGGPAFFGTFEELLDNSLITPSGSQGIDKHFYLTETVLSFASARFKAMPLKEQVEAKHRVWCLAFANDAAEGLYSTHQSQWLNAMDAAYEEMRYVISSGCLPRGDLEMAAQTLLACYPYLIERNYFREGFMMAEKIVQARSARRLHDYPRLLNVTAVFAYYLSELEEARRYATRSVRQSRKRKDPSMEGRARCTLGMAAQGQGLNRRARRHYLRAAAAMRGRDDNRLLTVLGNLIGVETVLELFESAAAHLAEAKTLEDRCTSKSTRTSVMLNAAHYAFSASDDRLAWRLSLDCLDGAIENRDDLTLALILRTFVRLLWQRGEAELAGVLIGAGQLVLAGSEAQPIDEGPVTYESTCAEVEKQLGTDAYLERVYEGRTLDREQMLAEVRRIAVENC